MSLGIKGDVIKLFVDKYSQWLENRNKINEERPKINHLSAGILKKRESKEEEDEEDRVETNSSLPGHEIFGFKNEINSLEDFLLDPKFYNDFKSLVVVGEYGVGKTALCKMIFNKDEVKSVYAPRIWVSMHNKETEDKKISVLKRILKGLGVEDNMLDTIHEEAVQEAATKQEAGEIDGETMKEKELSALLYALHLNLRWKKYLIVFDDVREEDSWDEKLDEKLKENEKWGKYLSDGFPKGSGGRVIYTTRDPTMAKKLVAEDHKIHRLWPLSDPQSVWKIYEAAVRENEEEYPPRNDKKCIEELMNKSRGLPLAARMMAMLLPIYLDTEYDEQNNATNGTTEPAYNLFRRE